MKVAIIINGISRKKKFFYESIYPILKQKFNAEVFETQHAQHAIELASTAAAEKFTHLIAAGGDGTLNQVVNGVLKNHSNEASLPALGIIPLGTGNDFARLCGIKPDADQLASLISQNNPKPTDVGRVECQGENGETITRYFINVCSMGMGPAVVKRLLTSDRSLGPTITYLKSITQTFFTHQPEEISLKTATWEWRGKMRVLTIANGRSFGNGMYIAKDALPDDGIFSLFLAKEVPLMKFLLFVQMLKSGRKINDSLIVYDHCTSIEISAPQPCLIEAEGEMIGLLPARVEVVPKRINFLR